MLLADLAHRPQGNGLVDGGNVIWGSIHVIWKDVCSKAMCREQTSNYWPTKMTPFPDPAYYYQ